MDSKPTNEKTRRRCWYEGSGLNIEPYHKRPKMVTSTLLPLSDERRVKVPNSLKKGTTTQFSLDFWPYIHLTGSQEMYQCGLAGIPGMFHGKRACKMFDI